MIKWGQKSKPRKIPGPKFNPPSPPQKKSHAEFPSRKNFQKTLRCNKEKNANISFEYPKKSVLKSSDPKKILRSPLSCAIQSTPRRLVNHHNLIFMCKKPGQCFAEGYRQLPDCAIEFKLILTKW